MSHTIYANGIHGDTGRPLLPGLTLEEIASFARPQSERSELEEYRRLKKLREKDHLQPRFGIDPKNLAEAGWGVIFPEGRESELRESLAPLLDLRREQAGRIRSGRYRELTYRRDESKGRFLARHGVGPGPVEPDRLPYYLLLVGDPVEIPFSFQYQLDVQYAVGRLDSTDPLELRSYAETVVRAERGEVSRPRSLSFFAPSHPGDSATELSASELVAPLLEQLAAERSTWDVESLLGDAATKAELGRRLGGEQTPALLFTASHGVGFECGDPRQLSNQGALLCQDWPGAGTRALHAGDYFSAQDVDRCASVAGLIAFVFACYGAGTPAQDSFYREGLPEQIAPRDFVAPLPRRLLGHPNGSALAVIGHVDRAWTYSFLWSTAEAQLAAFKSVLDALLDGHPVGSTMEYFNQRYAEVATDLGQLDEETRWGVAPDFMARSSLWVAMNDARCYVVLGDPAVRLAIEPATNGASVG